LGSDCGLVGRLGIGLEGGLRDGRLVRLVVVRLVLAVELAVRRAVGRLGVVAVLAVRAVLAVLRLVGIGLSGLVLLVAVALERADGVHHARAEDHGPREEKRSDGARQ